jgi:hypothetical protein
LFALLPLFSLNGDFRRYGFQMVSEYFDSGLRSSAGYRRTVRSTFQQVIVHSELPFFRSKKAHPSRRRCHRPVLAAQWPSGRRPSFCVRSLALWSGWQPGWIGMQIPSMGHDDRTSTSRFNRLSVSASKSSAPIATAPTSQSKLQISTENDGWGPEWLGRHRIVTT